MWKIIRLRQNKRQIISQGETTLIIIGAVAYKFLSSDVNKIEKDTRKKIEELNDEDIKKIIRSMGIKKIDLTLNDEKLIKNSFIQH
jgi:hypothetical protein